jgi:hypothetical protein
MRFHLATVMPEVVSSECVVKMSTLADNQPSRDIGLWEVSERAWSLVALTARDTIGLCSVEPTILEGINAA